MQMEQQRTPILKRVTSMELIGAPTKKRCGLKKNQKVVLMDGDIDLDMDLVEDPKTLHADVIFNTKAVVGPVMLQGYQQPQEWLDALQEKPNLRTLLTLIAKWLDDEHEAWKFQFIGFWEATHNILDTSMLDKWVLDRRCKWWLWQGNEHHWIHPEDAEVHHYLHDGTAVTISTEELDLNIYSDCVISRHTTRPGKFLIHSIPHTEVFSNISLVDEAELPLPGHNQCIEGLYGPSDRDDSKYIRAKKGLWFNGSHYQVTQVGSKLNPMMLSDTDTTEEHSSSLDENEWTRSEDPDMDEDIDD